MKNNYIKCHIDVESLLFSYNTVLFKFHTFIIIEDFIETWILFHND